MRRSIGTVSLDGTLREKLEANAAARFDGFERFEPDLVEREPARARVLACAGAGAERAAGAQSSAGQRLDRAAFR